MSSTWSVLRFACSVAKLAEPKTAVSMASASLLIVTTESFDFRVTAGVAGLDRVARGLSAQSSPPCIMSAPRSRFIVFSGVGRRLGGPAQPATASPTCKVKKMKGIKKSKLAQFKATSVLKITPMGRIVSEKIKDAACAGASFSLLTIFWALDFLGAKTPRKVVAKAYAPDPRSRRT